MRKVNPLRKHVKDLNGIAQNTLLRNHMFYEGPITRSGIRKLALKKGGLESIPGLGKVSIIQIKEWLGLPNPRNISPMALQRARKTLERSGYKVIPPK